MKKILSVAVCITAAWACSADAEPSLDLSSEAVSSVLLAGNDKQRGVQKVERVETSEVKTARVTGKNARKQKQRSDEQVTGQAVTSSDDKGSAKSGKMKHAMHDGTQGRRAKKKEHVADIELKPADRVN